MHKSNRPPDQEATPLPEVQDLAGERSSAPNIFLDLPARRNRWEVRVAAVFGIVLQLGVIVFSGVSTGSQRLGSRKGDALVGGYAFPLTAIGTLMLVAGMLICSFVVERSTEEQTWITRTPHAKSSSAESIKTRDTILKESTARILWLQKG